MAWFWVAIGGGLGSIARYGCARWLAGCSTTWPFATLLVNVLGAFLLGLVFEAGAGRQLLSVDVRLPLGTGLMGGFTTYSTFSLEVALSMQRGEPLRALTYVGATLVLALLASFAGLALGRALSNGASI